MQLPYPWSYSTLSAFESCPRKFYEVKVKKAFVEPPTVHTDWGKEVHAAFEYRIRDGTPLPPTMQQWTKLADRLAALPGQKLTEWQIALDQNLCETSWDQAWTRGVVDLAVIGRATAVILDYKTGKQKPTEQLDLYAAYIFALRPEIECVQTGLVWLAPRKITKSTLRRDELPSLWQGFLERVARLQAAHTRESWIERPSGLCNGWCPVSTCPHNRKK